jgi:hypothetical protein
MTKLIINCVKVPKKSSVVQAVKKKGGRGGRGNLTMFHVLPTHYCKHKNGDETKAAHY